MKRTIVTIFILVWFTLLVLAGCSTPSATTAPASEVQVATEAPSSNAAATVDPCAAVPTPSVDVAALITEKLQNHHAEDRIYSAVHTREEWNATLDRMIGYGAVTSEEEKQVIIDYLLCFKP
jgi:ABC-type transport system substrate-binding protein